MIPQSEDAAVRIDGLWEFDTADKLFVFVHGLNADPALARDLAYTVERGLAEIRPIPGICYSWDSDTGWDTAKRIATGNGQLLAAWLSQWAETDGRPIHLIGYSLGARVSAEALRALNAMDRRNALRSVSLLGGAIPHDSVTRDGRYGDAIDAFDGPVNNFHSSADRVLGWVYRAAERTRAVGSHGSSDPTLAPSGYLDVDVTDIVADHYSYFTPGEGCLPQVVERLP